MLSSATPLDPGVRWSATRSLSWVVLVPLILVALVSTFESTMMYTAIPQMQAGLHASARSVGWVLTGYLLVGAASAAISGRLGDIFGRKNVLLVLLVLSLVGSVVSYATGTLGGVIVGRSIQGLAGGLLPLCFGIVRENTPERSKLPLAISIIAGAAMISGAIGNISAGHIVDWWGWRYAFVVAGIATIITIGASFALPKSKPSVLRGSKIDWLGGVLFAPALALVLFGINSSSGGSWSTGVWVGSIVLGLVLLLGWTLWELRQKTPMVNVRMLKERNLGLTLACSAILGVPLGIAGFGGQIIMQYPKVAPVGFGLSAGTAGTVSFGCSLLGICLIPVSARIARNGRARWSLTIGAAVGVVAALLSAFTAVNLHSLWPFIGSQLVLTVSTLFLLSSLPMLIVQSASEENTSEATGLNTVFQTAFNGVGTSVGTAILAGFAVQVVPGFSASSKSGYWVIFGASAALEAVGLCLALFLRNQSRPTVGTGTDVIETASEEIPLSAALS